MLRQELKCQLKLLLQVAEMSSSSYHDACKRAYKAYPRELINEMISIRDDNPDYGYRRVTYELHNRGFTANHKVVLKIMKTNGLLCTAFDRLTRKYNSYAGHVGHIAPNRVNRRFTTDRPYQKILTDVTEVRFGTGTMAERAYFTAFIDVYSGEMLTWNIDRHPTVAFITKPLDELLQNRPELNYRMTIHSDQGFQYQNYEYVSRLKTNRVFQSMSRKATCLDNAMAESIFHILKVGTVHNNHYQNYDDLKSAITKYVYYYNNKRIKTKLAGKTPVQYRNLSDQLVA